MPKERVMVALAGGMPDVVPVYGNLWGPDYIWKLTGKRFWEVANGPLEPDYGVISAVQRRHSFDMIEPRRYGDGWLVGKDVEENKGMVIATERATGRQFRFDYKGKRWVGLDSSEGETLPLHQRERGYIPEKDEVDHLLAPPVKLISADLEKARFEGELIRKQLGKYFTFLWANAPFTSTIYWLGFATAMRTLMRAPEIFKYIEDRFLSYELTRTVPLMEATGIDAGFLCECYTGDTVSIDKYRKLALPYQSKLVLALHEHGLKSMLWLLGYTVPVLLDTVKLNVGAVQVEQSRKGFVNDIGKVRQIFGPEQCLIGNFDEAIFLTGNRRLIEKAVLAQLDAAGREGGFIMSWGGQLCDDTDPAMVDFFIKASRRYGRYHQ